MLFLTCNDFIDFGVLGVLGAQKYIIPVFTLLNSHLLELSRQHFWRW